MDLHAYVPDESHWWWILTLLVFAARVVDVSLGTLRMLFVSRGLKVLAPVVGFFEVLIWITVVSQVVRSLDNWLWFIAYAEGFGLGTYVGLAIEQRLLLGTIIVRVITQQEGNDLASELRGHRYGVTCIDAQGLAGPVKIIFSVIARRDLPRFLKIVKTFNPQAFYTVEDVRAVSRKAFPLVAGGGPTVDVGPRPGRSGDAGGA